MKSPVPFLLILVMTLVALVGGYAAVADATTDQKSPTAERPAFKEGASFTFKNWTGEWTQSYMGERDDLLIFRHANRKKSWEVSFTKDLALVRTKGRGDDIENTPHSGFLAFPLHVGKTWEHSFTHAMIGSNQVYQRVLRARVAAYERVSVPAGTFWAYRIETEVTTVGYSPASETYWYSPEVGFHIKYQSREFQWEYELIRFSK